MKAVVVAGTVLVEQLFATLREGIAMLPNAVDGTAS
jgi:hypothetical protein